MACRCCLTPRSTCSAWRARCREAISLSARRRVLPLSGESSDAPCSLGDEVIASNPSKLADVRRFTEPFKRLGERLHPHKYQEWAAAQDVFAVARGEHEARSLAGRMELALAGGKPRRGGCNHVSGTGHVDPQLRSSC